MLTELKWLSQFQQINVLREGRSFSNELIAVDNHSMCYPIQAQHSIVLGFQLYWNFLWQIKHLTLVIVAIAQDLAHNAKPLVQIHTQQIIEWPREQGNIEEQIRDRIHAFICYISRLSCASTGNKIIYFYHLRFLQRRFDLLLRLLTNAADHLNIK